MIPIEIPCPHPALTPPSPPALVPLSQAWERLALLGFAEGLARQDRGVGGEGKIGANHTLNQQRRDSQSINPLTFIAEACQPIPELFGRHIATAQTE